MICFFTYLITFQSLQHIYKHPPTHVFASADDDKRHLVTRFPHALLLLSKAPTCAGVLQVWDECRPISNMCPAKKVLHARGFRTFHRMANTPPCTQRLSAMRARVCTRLSRKANPSDSFIEPVKAVKGAPSTSFRLGLARKERSSKAR